MLRWQLPVTNVDGTAVTDLAGCKIYWGQVSRVYSNVVTLAGATVTQGVVNVSDLPLPGWASTNYSVAYTGSVIGISWSGVTSSTRTLYFAGTCYNIVGNESDFSDECTRTQNTAVLRYQLAWGISATALTSTNICPIVHTPGISWIKTTYPRRLLYAQPQAVLSSGTVLGFPIVLGIDNRKPGALTTLWIVP